MLYCEASPRMRAVYFYDILKITEKLGQETLIECHDEHIKNMYKQIILLSSTYLTEIYQASA